MLLLDYTRRIFFLFFFAHIDHTFVTAVKLLLIGFRRGVPGRGRKGMFCMTTKYYLGSRFTVILSLINLFMIFILSFAFGNFWLVFFMYLLFFVLVSFFG